jgi:hypothetical protein
MSFKFGASLKPTEVNPLGSPQLGKEYPLQGKQAHIKRTDKFPICFDLTISSDYFLHPIRGLIKTNWKKTLWENTTSWKEYPIQTNNFLNFPPNLQWCDLT